MGYEHEWTFDGLLFLTQMAHTDEHLKDCANEINRIKPKLTAEQLEELRQVYREQHHKVKTGTQYE
jgi:hypothetical protein